LKQQDLWVGVFLYVEHLFLNKTELIDTLPTILLLLLIRLG